MFERRLELQDAVTRRSQIVLGPRGTGKSALIRKIFPKARTFDLSDGDTYRALNVSPESLRLTLKPEDRIVVVDEIQRLPRLAEQVAIASAEDPARRFVLTESSARRLHRGGVNPLEGCAWLTALHPLTAAEVGLDDLPDLMLYGGLPAVLTAEDSWRELKEYVGNYLREEIRAEALVRSTEAFARFLEVVGFSNGRPLNYTAIGADAEVPARTVREYVALLEDTLFGYQLAPFQTSRKRRSVSTGKFFLFDVGVAHSLQGITSLAPGTESHARALEHLIANELRACLSYFDIDLPLNYWRSLSQIEVDFVLGDQLAVQVEAAGRPGARDTKGLRALGDEIRVRHRILVTAETAPSTLEGGIEVIPAGQFLRRLWEGEFWE